MNRREFTTLLGATVAVSPCSGLQADVLSFWGGAGNAHPDEEAHGRHEAARGSRGPRRCGGCVANDGGAQQSAKLPTIGYLGPNARSLDSQRLAAFVLRLRELGWIEDRTVTIEYRFAEGRNEHLAEFAADFVTRKVDVIVTSATPPTVTGKQVTSVIPIVFAALGDPVGARVVARPRFHGRNL